MFDFGKKKDPKQMAREAKRETRKSQRQLDRERTALDREEQKITAEIKKAAKQGNEKGAKILAKQLLQTRKQKEKLLQMSSQIGAMGMRTQLAATQHTMMTGMQSTTKVMGAMNKSMNPQKMQETMRNFVMENERAGMTEEMMDDALGDAFDVDSEEEDAVVDQVMQEIGLDLNALMADAPNKAPAAAAPAEAEPTEEEKAQLSEQGKDLLARLEAL